MTIRHGLRFHLDRCFFCTCRITCKLRLQFCWALLFHFWPNLFRDRIMHERWWWWWWLIDYTLIYLVLSTGYSSCLVQIHISVCTSWASFQHCLVQAVAWLQVQSVAITTKISELRAWSGQRHGPQVPHDFQYSLWLWVQRKDLWNQAMWWSGWIQYIC